MISRHNRRLLFFFLSIKAACFCEQNLENGKSRIIRLKGFLEANPYGVLCGKLDEQFRIAISKEELIYRNSESNRLLGPSISLRRNIGWSLPLTFVRV
jgi:hypothetical protein